MAQQYTEWHGDWFKQRENEIKAAEERIGADIGNLLISIPITIACTYWFISSKETVIVDSWLLGEHEEVKSIWGCIISVILIFIFGIKTFRSLGSCLDDTALYKSLKKKSPEEYAIEHEAEFRATHILCPFCKKYFDDDKFKRYVIGTLTNTLKFAGNLSLRLGGHAVGAMIADGAGGTLGKRAGGMLADKMGMGEKDMNGWQHQCPYCKNRFKS